MFTLLQRKRLIAELRGVLAGGDLPKARRSKTEEVLEGAVEARMLSGYPFIEGD